MSSDERIRQRGTIRKAMLILGLTMILFFIGFGLWILTNPSALPDLPAQYRTIFGVIILIYGLYRGWRLYADHS